MTPLEILNKMEEIYPNAKTELANWETPFQFLVCIVLSAQATDKGVNKVTKALFEKYPDAQAMSKADIEDVDQLVKSINYHHTKATHIVELSKKILTDFNGVLPRTEKELTTLPGVGRKTAHVLLNDLYQQNDGIAVDTHVMRVSQRLGLTQNTDPKKVASDLEKIYPREVWHKVNSLFVLYGRYICRAKMKKSNCVFKGLCSYCTDLPEDK